MASLRKTATTLLTAINLKGDKIYLEEKRWYSTQCQHIVTKYIVRRKEPGVPRVTLIETCKIHELVIELAALYSSLCEVENGAE